MALSATLAQPEVVAARYFGAATTAQVPGGRVIRAEQLPIAADLPAALLDYLATFRRRGWRKALVFCNTRAEVESYATALRAAGSPFGDAIYVHYSNLDAERRREIEHLFAQAQVAICFASSTLELGIDIGDIDVAILVGAPGSSAAFTQRLGRAGRRQRVARVACFYRTPLEHAIFGALLTAGEDPAPQAAFRPSVAIQQIFSLLKQSPSGALRLNPLAELFTGLLSVGDLRRTLGTLHMRGYLQSGRPGEWRAGAKLNRLVDLQAAESTPLSLHSNIESSGGPQLQIRDQMTQRVVASVDHQWFDRDLLTLEGRPLNVHWYDGEALWVSPYRGPDAAAHLRYVSTRQLLSYDLARALPAQFGPARGVAPLVPHEDGLLLFHWLGDIYGRALLDLLKGILPADETAQPGLCLRLRDEPRDLPRPTVSQVEQYLADHYGRYEPLLALGAYHHLLPPELRRQAVVAQFDVPRFVAAVADLRVARAPDATRTGSARAPAVARGALSRRCCPRPSPCGGTARCGCPPGRPARRRRRCAGSASRGSAPARRGRRRAPGRRRYPRCAHTPASRRRGSPRRRPAP